MGYMLAISGVKWPPRLLLSGPAAAHCRFEIMVGLQINRNQKNGDG
jgi:hypothetical protein